MAFPQSGGDKHPKILFWVEGWGFGGIETFMMNLLKSEAFQRLSCSFDLFCVCDWNDGFDTQIEDLGGRRMCVSPGQTPSLGTKLCGSVAAFRKVMDTGCYNAVYVNATNGLCLLYAWMAQRARVPIRVVHSHNSAFDEAGKSRALKTVAHSFGKVMFSGAPTDRIAVSKQAGDFVFGGREYRVIPNGVDVERFAFDREARAVVRNELDIAEDTLLVGNVGRLDERKNPLFLLDVFAKVRRMNKDAKALFVGEGKLKDELSHKARILGCESQVIILPATMCPESYYSALDILVMPSVTEGFGLTAIEAQCSGLPVVVSDALPAEVCISKRSRQLSLDLSPKEWANSVVALVDSNGSREDAFRLIAGTKFDSEYQASAIVNRCFQSLTRSVL